MDGRVTYADTDAAVETRFVRWFADSNNYIISRSSTSSTNTGLMIFEQASAGVYDNVSSTNQLTPDILAPFNIASRRGSTFVNGALDGISATANTTPVSLPDLSATDLNLGHLYNGTIRTFRLWANDIGDAGLVEATAETGEEHVQLEGEPYLVTTTHDYAIDLVGVIYEPTGVTLTDDEGNEYPATAPLDGWHLNIRLLNDTMRAAVEAIDATYGVTPISPSRVWA
jgi:hypothetical protein